ncbi:MAG: hypothetical protein ACWA5P_07825 [bacterium]
MIKQQQIKLIWDFRGPDGHEIAKHHLIHLDEYVAQSNKKVETTGVHQISDMHAIAYMVVNKSDMLFFRDALKPHRGEYYTTD